MISGTVNGHPIKLIGLCDIKGYPYVVQYRTTLGRWAIEAYNEEGVARSGMPIKDFVNAKEMEFDV